MNRQYERSRRPDSLSTAHRPSLSATMRLVMIVNALVPMSTPMLPFVMLITLDNPGSSLHPGEALKPVDCDRQDGRPPGPHRLRRITFRVATAPPTSRRQR